MKKITLIIRSTVAAAVGLAALLLSSPTWGQDSTGDAAAAAADSASQARDIRPEMPRLFYTSKQRRVLEAVRQDVISEEDFEDEDFVPLILQQEQIDITTPEQTSREETIAFDSFIRNRNTGAGVWWSGREEHGFSTAEDDDLSKESGLVDFLPAEEGDGSLVGIDKFNRTRFVLKVGQQLSPEGEVSERYPVVIKKKN